MDPNETLRQIRKAYRAILALEDVVENAAILAERVEDLDTWLKQGGFPPDAWKQGGG